jgi:hypothetical protein
LFSLFTIGVVHYSAASTYFNLLLRSSDQLGDLFLEPKWTPSTTEVCITGVRHVHLCAAVGGTGTNGRLTVVEPEHFSGAMVVD